NRKAGKKYAPNPASEIIFRYADSPEGHNEMRMTYKKPHSRSKMVADIQCIVSEPKIIKTC
ncbi:MAG: hypothetical protein KJ649_01910, partial [Proteobacteria bacterium]|nr:hypothetical protein [Pseudomonadota bacterium]